MANDSLSADEVAAAVRAHAGLANKAPIGLVKRAVTWQSARRKRRARRGQG